MHFSANSRGYFLFEWLLTLSLLGIALTLAHTTWSGWQDERRLDLAAGQMVSVLHEVQQTARSSTGPDILRPTLHIHGAPANDYYTTRGQKRIAPKGKLPEGISFATGQPLYLQFQENGKLLGTGQRVQTTYRLILHNKKGAQRAVVISAQTGRIRVEK